MAGGSLNYVALFNPATIMAYDKNGWTHFEDDEVGDKIGRRRLDTHFLGISELGADFSYNEKRGIYEITANKLTGKYMLWWQKEYTKKIRITK